MVFIAMDTTFPWQLNVLLCTVTWYLFINIICRDLHTITMGTTGFCEFLYLTVNIHFTFCYLCSSILSKIFLILLSYLDELCPILITFPSSRSIPSCLLFLLLQRDRANGWPHHYLSRTEKIRKKKRMERDHFNYRSTVCLISNLPKSKTHQFPLHMFPSNDEVFLTHQVFPWIYWAGHLLI